MTKLLNVAGLLLKPEASYGAGGTLAAATDGVQMMEVAQLTRSWADPGERGLSISPSEESRVRASGGSYEGPVRVRVKGGGAPYSASVTPKDLHNLFRGSGHAATLDATSGAEKYTYTPASLASGATPTSLVGECYYRGQKYTLKGVLGNLIIRGQAGQTCQAEYALRGLLGGDIADSAVPAITYATTVEPPKLESALFKIGDFEAGVIRSFEFDAGVTIQERLNANAATHGGFVQPTRAPRLTISLEQSALVATPYHAAGGLDPYKLYEMATALGISFQIGSTKYNRLKFAAAQAQLAQEPTEGEANGIATWDLTFLLPPSSLGALDHYSWVAD